MQHPLPSNDLLTFIPIAILLFILFKLSNREIKKSLKQSQDAQRLLARELKESRLARLDELAKAAEFGRMSQGLFHDLVTPLTSIILHTEKLREGGVIQKNLDKAVEASNRMAKYLKDVRATLSHEETERQCDLREELEGVLHVMEYKSRQAGVDIQITQTELCTWHGNPLKLRQIFSNLISNAIDSFDGIDGSRKKKIEIRIAKEGNSLVVKVTDSGSGISPENIPHIFEPFFTTKAADKGTGIGLATVKTIVEKDLKGTIEVESEIGNGSTFSLSFPTQYTNPGASHPHPHTPPHLG